MPAIVELSLQQKLVNCDELTKYNSLNPQNLKETFDLNFQLEVSMNHFCVDDFHTHIEECMQCSKFVTFLAHFHQHLLQ